MQNPELFPSLSWERLQKLWEFLNWKCNTNVNDEVQNCETNTFDIEDNDSYPITSKEIGLFLSVMDRLEINDPKLKNAITSLQREHKTWEVVGKYVVKPLVLMGMSWWVSSIVSLLAKVDQWARSKVNDYKTNEIVNANPNALKDAKS